MSQGILTLRLYIPYLSETAEISIPFSESTSATSTASALLECQLEPLSALPSPIVSPTISSRERPRQHPSIAEILSFINPLDANLPPLPDPPTLLHSSPSGPTGPSVPPPHPSTSTPALPLPITPKPFIQPDICAALQVMPASLLLSSLENGVPLFSLAEPISPEARLSAIGTSSSESPSSEPIDRNIFVNVHSSQSPSYPIDLTTIKSLKPFPWTIPHLCAFPYYPFQIPRPNLELSLEMQQLLTQCIIQSMIH